ncbi:class A beta-lactamase [Streptomyces sp. SP17BM10]|uniref:class A beta-lactamase n=1 Tax=Streptomyces sp. SP17BM10 TaxID=3002530 RepID=UPI002E79AF46|nr:class A beta-lactamase [Streptomyces sp. SP17BM10]MEE1783696.1 class A beta-lactamase [Streptomyces sp. SP17BM10]
MPSVLRHPRTTLPAIALLAVALLTGCGHNATSATTPTTAATETTSASFKGLEQQFGARLGVYALDTGSGREVSYRADERFAFASTIKSLAAGALLRKASDDQLDKVVPYRQEDVLSWAPITSQHVATGMTVRDLAAAAIQYSDNTAANLVTAELGGPAAVQQTLRDLGDTTTSVDRTEPTLNEATPGDTRDTSTPRAFAADLRHYALGDTLTEDRRRLLTDWLVGNTTGGPYIRAGVPSDWKIGDKTGNGGYGTRNDVAVAWPAGGRSPIVIVVLSDRGKADATSDDALIAQATKTVVGTLG